MSPSLLPIIFLETLCEKVFLYRKERKVKTAKSAKKHLCGLCALCGYKDFQDSCELRDGKDSIRR
jgi:hypothetical protein